MEAESKYTKEEYNKYVKSFKTKFAKEKGFVPATFKEWLSFQPDADAVMKEFEEDEEEEINVIERSITENKRDSINVRLNRIKELSENWVNKTSPFTILEILNTVEIIIEEIRELTTESIKEEPDDGHKTMPTPNNNDGI